MQLGGPARQSRSCRWRPYLCQAAGFKNAGDQDNVACGVDEVREGLIEAEAEGCIAVSAHLTGQAVKLCLDLGVWRRAQEHKLAAPVSGAPCAMLYQLDACMSSWLLASVQN